MSMDYLKNKDNFMEKDKKRQRENEMKLNLSLSHSFSLLLDSVGRVWFCKFNSKISAQFSIFENHPFSLIDNFREYGEIRRIN